MSIPARISTPAARAPALLPPAPQNISKPLITRPSNLCSTAKLPSRDDFDQPARGLETDLFRVVKPNGAAQTRPQRLLITRFAFPDNFDAPAERLKRLGRTTVSGDIGLELGRPEVSPCAWISTVSASLVPVPEAAMDEYCKAVAGQYKVGPSRQILAVQAEAEPGGVRHPAHRHFWLRILASDAPHVFAAT